ncbi:MAG: cytochrome b/b6 domain-containing protein [Gammaproteobacteria bacterium]|nr:cytochrome b/b6 domain-containing protein [Gammaproteobacteria bacterium]MDH5629602.1 cytochrome b/b6 domain-containing protein [Gammaproteobacteria bacterium]
MKIYDIPTRIYHWLTAILFTSAFAIANTVDDESSLFPYHMLFGLMLLCLLIFRIIWGFIGSRHARFSAFLLKPQQLIQYFKDSIKGGGKRYAGHNPASSYSAIIIFISILVMATTGLLMANHINKHFFEDVHELFANLFLFTVIFHLAGLVIHQMKFRDNLSLSMIHGSKQPIEDEKPVQQPAKIVSLVFSLLMILSAFHLFHSYDNKEQTLKVFTYQLQLGEDEHHEKHEKSSKHHDDDHDDDDHE